MRMSLCLLACSAVVLWVTLVVAAPHSNPNLNEIIEQIEDYMKAYNGSHTQKGFVDSARELAEGPGRCGKKFFCAVHDSLHKHTPKPEKVYTIMRSLKNYLTHQHINCTQALMNTTRTTVELQLRPFLSDIEGCIRCRNLNTTSTSC